MMPNRNDDDFFTRLRRAGLLTEDKPRAVPKYDGPAAAPGDPRARAYAEAALRDECAILAATPEGRREITANTAAFKIGGLVAAGHLDGQLAVDSLIAAGVACGLPLWEATAKAVRGTKQGALKAPRVVQLRSDGPTPAGYTIDPAEVEGFWDARPVHQHLYQFAKARRVGPWAILGAALASITTAIDPSVVLPPLVGASGSLNTFVALVGPSGGGKGAAEGAAHEAIRLPEQVARVGVGSGEGILHQYARYVPPRKNSPGRIERVADRVLFSAAEVDQLGALKQRTGSTLMPMLRDAWSGAMLSNAYADPSKRITLDAHTYRLSLIVGVQPGRAGVIFDDVDGGTPQRFLWLPVGDSEAPDDPPPCPEPVQWETPLLPPLGQFDGHRVMQVCDQATDEIDKARLSRLRGEGDALDGHLLLCRLKTGAALAALDGRIEVSKEDWHLAGVVMQVSQATRDGVGAHLREAMRDANKARGLADAERALLAEEVKEKAGRERVVKSIRRALEAGPLPHHIVRKKISSPYRIYFEDAMRALLVTGDVVETTADNDGNPGLIYRLKGESK